MENNIFYGWNKEDIKLQADNLGIKLDAEQIDWVTKQVIDDFGENERFNEWANQMIQKVIMKAVNQNNKLFLLSEEEYNENKVYIANKEYILNEKWWWLRTPYAHMIRRVGYVEPQGYVTDYSGTYYDGNGVRPAFKFISDIFDDREIGSIINFGKLDWIKLKDGIYLSKDILFNHRFDEKFNDYNKSEIKNKLKECESWWFTENELSMLENFNNDKN